MPSLNLPGQASLYYLDEGPDEGPSDEGPSHEGPSDTHRAVLLLHGLGATSASWALQFPALRSAGWRVLAPDTPGFGRSHTARRYRSVTEMAAFIPALLDHLGLAKVCLVGLSMGGTQALQFALDHPQRVERLALANTFAHLDLFANPRLWPYYLARTALVVTRGLPAQAQAVAQRIFPAPEQQALRAELVRQTLQAQPNVYRSAMLALARFNRQARLGQVQAPALVITGAQDTTVPSAVQRRLAHGLPHARQVVIAHAGHAASVDQPAEFNRLLLAFLAEPTQYDLQASPPTTK